MRKTAVALAMALLITAAAGTQLVNLATANPLIIESYTASPNITIDSPLNKTYVNNVLLNFTVAASESWLSRPISFEYEPGSGLAQKLLSVDYYLDGTLCESVTANSHLLSPFNYSIQLTDVEDGNHRITVITHSSGVERDWISSKVYNVPANGSSSTVHFALDTIAPSISVLSARLTIEPSETFPLNFTVNESVSKVSCVLDGKENVTVAGNSTLTGLPVGLHNVTVYAWDAAGNVGASENVSFTVVEPESFPTAPVVAVSAVCVSALVVGLLLFTRGRRRRG